MPLLKSRKSIYSLYQRLGDDEEESGVEEAYEKFSSTGSDEFTNNDQRCNLPNDLSSEKSIEINLTNDNSTQSMCKENTSYDTNKNVSETAIKTQLDNFQENEVTAPILNISNLSIDDNKNYETNEQGTTDYDIYDVVTEENIYACIDEDIYATVNDSIDNNEDDIYATVDETRLYILAKREEKDNITASPRTNDKYNAITVLDNVEKDANIAILSNSLSPDPSIKPRSDTPSESKGHHLPNSEQRKILIPVRKAPPPPIKPPVSKTIKPTNNLTGRKNSIKRIPFPPDVIICNESIYQIPTVKYPTLNSKNINLSKRSSDLTPYEKVILRNPRNSHVPHVSSSYIGGRTSFIASETPAKEKNPIYGISFNSPIVQLRENTQPLSSEVPPALPPKENIKYEVRSVTNNPVRQPESILTTSGSPILNPIRHDPMSTYTRQTSSEDERTPGCSPEILRDLRHGLMKSERPLRESAIFYTKAQPYPGNHSPGADTKKL